MAAERFGKQLTPDVLAVKKGGSGLGTAALGSVLVANTLDVYTSLAYTAAPGKVLRNDAGVITWGDLGSLSLDAHILDDHADVDIDGTWDPLTGYTLLGVELADNEFLAYDTVTHRFINQNYVEAGFGTVYSYNVGILHNQVVLLDAANEVPYTLLPLFIGDDGAPGTSKKGVVPPAAQNDWVIDGKYLNAGGAWTVPAGGGGEANTASNVGGHFGWYKQKVASDLEFKTVQSSDGSLDITSNASDVDIIVDVAALLPTLEHNLLAGLQGGAGTHPLAEYYHLDNNQHNLLTDIGGIQNADTQHTHNILSLSPKSLTKGNGIVYSVGATYDTTVAVTIGLDYETVAVPLKAGVAVFGVATSVSRSDHVHLVNAFSELSDTTFVGLANLDIAQWNGAAWINVAVGTALAYTGGDGIDITGTVVSADYEPTNLRITGAALLNTIQDIDVTAVPEFSNLTLSLHAGDVGKYLKITAGGLLAADTPAGLGGYWSQVGAYLYNTALLTENVGIGIADPSTQLELKGDLSFTEDVARNLYVQKRSTLGDGYGLTIYADEAGAGVGSYTGGNLVLLSGAGSGTGGSNTSGKIAIYAGSGDNKGDVYLNRNIVGTAIGNVFLGVVDTDNTEDTILVITSTGEIKSTSKALITDVYWDRVTGGTNYLIPATPADSVKIGGVGVPIGTVEVEGDITLSKNANRELYLVPRSTAGTGYDFAIMAGDASGTSYDGGRLILEAGDGSGTTDQGGLVSVLGGSGTTYGDIYLNREHGGTLRGNVFLGNVDTDDITNNVLVLSSTGKITTTVKSGFSGTTLFTSLTDTPANYVGKAGWLLQVNSVPDALEFIQTISDDQHGQRSHEDSGSNLLHPVFAVLGEGFVPAAPLLSGPGTYLTPLATWEEMKDVFQDTTVIEWRYGLKVTDAGSYVIADIDYVTVPVANFKITSDQLDTIQDIYTGATPEFVSAILSGLTIGETVRVGLGNVLESFPSIGTDEKVAISNISTAGYIGAAYNDGVLRVDSTIEYTLDPLAGDFITLSIDPTQHVHTFLLLSDVDETTYVGHAGYLTHVNAGETDIEFIEPESIGVGLWLRNTVPSPNTTYLANSTDYVGLGMDDPEEKLEIDGNLVFSENVDRTIGVLRRTGVAGVGKGYDLTIQAGRAFHSIGDQIGGDLILKAGRGSGAASVSGNIYIYSGGDVWKDVKIGISELGSREGEFYVGVLSEEAESTHLVGWNSNYKVHSLVGGTDGQYMSWDHPNLKWVLHAAPVGGTSYWGVVGSNLEDNGTGGYSYIAPQVDLLTDRWLDSNTNTFLGVDIVGIGNLSHVVGDEGYYNVAIGNKSLYSITTGHSNVSIGHNAEYNLLTGTNNVSIGRNAFYGKLLSTHSRNVVIGTSAGQYLDASDTILIGYRAGVSDNVNYLTGTANLGIGPYAINSLTVGSNNISVGQESMKTTVSGHRNTCIGKDTGRYNETGDNNVAVGYMALGGNSTWSGKSISSNISIGTYTGQYSLGGDNIFIGEYAGQGNVAATSLGVNNIGIGTNSLKSFLGGDNNVGIGTSSFTALTTGSSNIAIGYQAGIANVSGNYNIILGTAALSANTVGHSNIAIGLNTLAGLNDAISSNASYNIAIGYGAGSTLVIAYRSLLIGTEANKNVSKSVDEVVIGYRAGYNHTHQPNGNVLIGSYAGQGTSGAYKHLSNVIIGANAGEVLQSTVGNVFLGRSSGSSQTNGNSNVYVGTATGQYKLDVSYNTFIGTSAGSGASGDTGTGSNNTAIGFYAHKALDTGSNNVAIGLQSLFSNKNGSGLISIGRNSFYGLDGTSTYSVAIGDQVGVILQTVSQSVFIGSFAGSGFSGTSSVTTTVAIGHYAGYRIHTSSSDNVFIGTNSGQGDIVAGLTGTSNVGIGSNTLYSLAGGDQNLCIGNISGYLITSGIGNVLIGTRAGESLTTEDRKFRVSTDIATTESNLIDGDFTDGWCRINDILILNPIAAAPGSPIEGMVYVNNVTNHIYCYINSGWKQLDN